MKNKSLFARFRFAWNGLCVTWRAERSFRTEVVIGIGVIVTLAYLRPKLIWWALFLLTMAGVLAAELLNTALERTLDYFHPKAAPMIGLAKDCAAGAVLVLNGAAIVILILFVADRLFF